MKDADCVPLLQWALPRLGLRWAGFRRVRRQVCRRLARRVRELGLGTLPAYRAYLDGHADEWMVLDRLCRIPISRFYRDRSTFECLTHVVLPELAERVQARGGGEVRAWSVGCASGEEPYTLSLIWTFCLAARCRGMSLSVVATDLDPHLLERARLACYRASSLKALPPIWIEAAFERRGPLWCVRDAAARGVEFRQQDVRTEGPDGPFDLVLCRNLVFTYFDAHLQRTTLARVGIQMAPGGFLVIGAHEALPSHATEFHALPGRRDIYQRGERGEP